MLELRTAFLWAIVRRDIRCLLEPGQRSWGGAEAVGEAVWGHDPHCQETKNI